MVIGKQALLLSDTKTNGVYRPLCLGEGGYTPSHYIFTDTYILAPQISD